MKKRVFVLFCFLTVAMAAVFGCGARQDKECAAEPQTVKERLSLASFEVPKGWERKTVTPYPSEEKIYGYKGMDCAVRFIKADSVSTLREECEKQIPFLDELENEDDIQVERKDTKLGGLDAKQIVVTLKADGDRIKKDTRIIVTGAETKTGVYLVEGAKMDSQQESEIYERLLNSFALTDKMDDEVRAQNTGQAENLLFPLRGWESRTETSRGMISYDTEDSSVRLIPLREGETEEEAINRAYREDHFYEAEKAWAKEAKNKKTDTGKVVRMKTAAEGESQTRTSSFYVLNTVKNEDGKAICVVLTPYEKQKAFPFPELLSSFKEAEPVYETVDTLWENRTEFTGDNSRVANLAEAAGFGEQGAYTLRLITEKEPCGAIVRYKKTIPIKDEERIKLEHQAGTLLGLVKNLGYVEIQSGQNQVRVTEEQVNGLIKQDMKKLAQDKGRLTAYVLETLWN